MQNNYKQIFWGIILLKLNFYIGPINAIPDFMGYILILLGIRGLYHETGSQSFKVIKGVEWGLVIFSIGISVGSFLYGGVLTESKWLYVIYAMIIVLNFAINYTIIRESIVYFSLEREKEDALIGYVIVMSVSILLTLTTVFLGTHDYTILIFIFGILMDVYTAFMIREFGNYTLQKE